MILRRLCTSFSAVLVFLWDDKRTCQSGRSVLCFRLCSFKEPRKIIS